MLKVIQGEDKSFTLILKKSDGRPFNLTGATEIDVCFPGTTATQSISLTGLEITVPNPTTGEILCQIPDAKTSLMKVGESQTFEAAIEFGAVKNKVKFSEQLTVESSIC